VKRERETRAMQMASGTPWETVTLTTLSRDRTLFAPLLAEARDAALRGQEGRLVVHTAWGADWRPFGLPRGRRPLRSVVLARGVAERIAEDLRAFLARRGWYADRGASLLSSTRSETDEGERDPVPQRVPAARTAWIGQVVVHSGARGLAVVRYLPAESLRAWLDRRQAQPPDVKCARAELYPHRRRGRGV